MKINVFQINKKLLPIKGHYFLQYAALAPISPFLPTIAKDLGFSSISLGWIFTITQIVSFFFKPMIASIADKFKIEKTVFILLLLLSSVSLFSIQWVPPVWNTDTSINCDSGLIEVCSENQIGDYITQISTNNTMCEITMKNGFLATREDPNFQIADRNSENKTYFTKTTTVSIHQILPSKVNCLNFHSIQKEDIKNICDSGFQNITMVPIDMKCEKISFAQLSSQDSGILSKYQFWMLLFLILATRVALGTCNTLADTICFHLLGDATKKYGLQRMWGSISWGIMAFMSSLIVDAISQGGDKDYSLSFYLILVFAIPDLLIVFNLKMDPKETSKSIWRDVTTVLKDAKIFLFLVWCFLNGYFLSSISNFLFWFVEDLDSAQGPGNSAWIKTLEGLISLIQTCGGEGPFFFLSGWILKKTGYVNAMTIVLLGSALRFFLYSIVTDPWLVLPIETLHGLSFGLFYATMTSYAKTISLPGTECTVQSLVSVTYEGAGASTGSLLTGYLIKSIGYTKTYTIMASCAFIFCVIHFCIVNFPLLSDLTARIKLKSDILYKSSIVQQ